MGLTQPVLFLNRDALIDPGKADQPLIPPDRFVNQHRIEEFKSRIAAAEPPGTILDTALAAGFNAKSTFNAAFKRYEGITPSQYFRAKTLRQSPTFKNL